jgi:hypothetical protein
MVTTPTKNDLAWDVSLNAALNDLQSQVTANVASTATNSSNISALQTLTGNFSATANSFGLFGWSLDPAVIGTGQVVTNGTLFLSRVNVGVAGTATKLFWGINTVGVTPTAGQNFVSLFDSSGARLANIGVDARVTTTGLFTETINVGLSPGFYWVGFLFNAATAPAVYRGASLNATLANTNLAVSQLRFATNGTSLTATPASITPGSNAFSQQTLFAALA